MARIAARVLPALLVLMASLAASTPARADYAAGDPQDSTTKMDIRRASSQVSMGSYHGHPAKIVRFRIVFDKAVNWSALHSPDLLMAMDTVGTVSFDYRLDIFRQKFPGDPNLMHCWLRNASSEGVLSDDDVVGYSASGTHATCAFPKHAMTVRPSGVVRWRVQSRYTTDAAGTTYKYDDAPNDPAALYPHL
jgi:hypothetical protein